MSEIRATTISDAAGTGPIDLHKQSAAKAWVNFNGTGTVAIRDSVNVSSLTDNGTGLYTVSFTNAFSAADYSVSGTSVSGNVTGPRFSSSALVGSIQVLSYFNVFSDSSLMSTATHGVLA